MSVEKVSSVLLSVSALAIAGILAFRTFAQAPKQSNAGPEPAAVHLADWENLVPNGITVNGGAESPLTLIEFADMECPACREYHEEIKKAIQRYGDTLRVVYAAYPLPGHRFALPAARVIECADRVGQAVRMIDVLYAAQDSLGMVSWWDLGKRAGISDSAAFQECSSSSLVPARVDPSLGMARKLALPGTPSVILNGWKMPRPPRLDQIDSAVAVFARSR